MTSLTGQEPQIKQKGTPKGSNAIGFVTQIQSITLQYHTLIGSDGQEMTPGSSD